MRAEVLRVEDDGLALRSVASEGGPKELWLPQEEWSADPAEWQGARDSIAVGATLDIVSLGQTDASGRQMASQKQIRFAHVDRTWHNSQRILKVESQSRTLIRGLVGSVPAIVRLVDYNRVLDRNGIRPDLLDHKWLAKGDCLSGIVTAVVPSAGEIELQPNLAPAGFTRADLSGPATDQPRHDDLLPEAAHAILDEHVARKVSPLLLIEDDADCRIELTEYLRRNSVEVVPLESFETAERYLSMRAITDSTTVHPDELRFVVIDANLENGGADLQGLRVAGNLAGRDELPILIISGEPANRGKASDWGDVLVRDYLEKPFMMLELFEAMEASLAGTPTPLRGFLPRNGEAAPEDATDNATDRIERQNGEPDWDTLLAAALSELDSVAPGTVLAVFRLHPRSWRSVCVASYGGEVDWWPVRGKIGKSRIKDAATSDKPIVEGRCEPLGGHLWTSEMLSYRSFYGGTVDVGGHFTYVLVAFHAQGNAFSEDFQSAAILCRERIARVIEREQLTAHRKNETALASAGLSLECLAHEVRGQLVTHGSLAEILTSIMQDSSLNEADQVLQTRELADRLRRVVAGTIEKAKALSGWRGQQEDILVWRSLQQAVRGCRRALPKYMDHHSIVKLDEPADEGVDDLVVMAPAGALTVVLFNVCLNAAQQIGLMHPLRPHGRIWHSVQKRLDAFGSPWAVVAISDNGPGIHYEDWNRIFQPGYSTKPNGTGLGLSICRMLLNRVSDGNRRASIAVGQSTVWGGTTFVLRLPLVSRREDGDEP